MIHVVVVVSLICDHYGLWQQLWNLILTPETVLQIVGQLFLSFTIVQDVLDTFM